MLDFGFYLMDCMDGMKQFPDKYFDLAIVDPPYGCGGDVDVDNTINGAIVGRFEKYFGNDKRGHIGGGRMKKYGYGNWDIAPSEEYFKELFRVSKNQIIWGGNYFALPATRCFIVWRKTNVPEKFTMAMCEYAWTSFNQNAKVVELSALKQAGRFHPTQKPVALYEWLLNRYANDGDIILDTHVGSASSLIACHRTRHKFVGFEIDETYYKKAKERLDAVTAQMTIYDFLNNEDE